MRAYFLEDSAISAHQLLTSRYDVVVCPFEFLEGIYVGKKGLPGKVEHYLARNRGGRQTMSLTAALHSDFYFFSGPS